MGAAWALLVPHTAAATQAELAELLARATEAGRPNTPLRAYGELKVRNPDGERRDQVRFIERRDGAVRLDLRKAQVRVLVLPDGRAWLRKNDHTRPCNAGDPIPGTDLVCEDLRPFARERFSDARIADWGSTRMTVTLIPRDSSYSLYVITFDRKRDLPLKTLLYRETLNNLVKMRVDSDHRLVGQHWVPGRTTIEDFALRSTTELLLRWSQAPDLPPESFDPDFLDRDTGLTWPGATPSPAQ